jgi:hypothetical protein
MTGVRLDRAAPTAAKEATRSSMNTCVVMPECDARAIAIGVERDPGAIIATSTPSATHSSTKVAHIVAAADE